MPGPTIKLGPVRERPGFSGAGDLIQFVDIPYSIEETGSTGLVSIPKNQFSAELAQQLVTSDAEEKFKLHNLFS